MSGRLETSGGFLLRRRGFRGFLSAVIAGIAFAALLATAAFQLALASSNSASTEEFRLTRLSERWSDALRYFNSTFTDAMLDAAYIAAGCGASWNGDVCGNLSAVVPSYVSNASLNLSDYLVSVDATTFYYLCAEITAKAGYNRTFSVNVSLTLATNSSNARKTGNLNLTRFIDVNRSVEIFTVRVREAGELIRINVNCSA